MHPRGTRSAGATLSPMLRRIFSPVLFSLCLVTTAQTPQQPTPDAPPQPALTSAQTRPLNPALPTLFIVGDSTARNKEDLGWGDHLAPLFDTSRINVANRARAGRSSRTFINEGAWAAVLAELKPGDFVLIQMGHNDGGDLGGTKPRGTLKGIGSETQDVPQIIGSLAGQVEKVHTYGWYLRKYIADTRAHHATPILLTLTVRNIWVPGPDGTPHIERDIKSGDSTYDMNIRQVAAAEHVLVADMASVEADRLETLGQAATSALFPIDHTHTSPRGAELNADSVAAALSATTSPLRSFLVTSHP